MKSFPRRVAVLSLLLAATAWYDGPAHGAAQQGDEAIEPVSALRCWRRVDRGAVRIGEQFGMTITCRAVETDGGRAVPDTVGLEPESIDLLPFEVLAGERFADVARGAHRFFQYHYVLRLIGEDYFGRDIAIPSLELTYRIERPSEAGAVLPGRELTYVLLREPIRVLSLVPETAADIRGIPLEPLGAAEARLARADVLLLAAAGLGLVAVGVLALGVRWARQARRVASTPVARPVAAVSIAQAVLHELAAIRKENAAADWSRERIERGLAALRLTAAIALDHPLAERAADPGAAPRLGELRVRVALLSARWAMVSSAVTPALLVGDAPGRRASTASGADLDRLRQSLAVFTAARYARAGDPLPGALALALEEGIEVTQQLRFRALPPIRWAARVSASLRAWWQPRWKR